MSSVRWLTHSGSFAVWQLGAVVQYHWKSSPPFPQLFHNTIICCFYFIIVDKTFFTSAVKIVSSSNLQL